MNARKLMVRRLTLLAFYHSRFGPADPKNLFFFACIGKSVNFAPRSTNGSVVQLVRMPPCHGGGRGFESRPVRLRSLKQFLSCVGGLLLNSE